MITRAAALLLIGAALVSCGSVSGNAGEATIGHASGSATYQTVVGQPARVHLVIRDFSRNVPHLILSFTGPDNWLVDHGAISSEFSGCRVKGDELDCGVFPTNTYQNIGLSGLATRAGLFHYTVTLWSDQGGRREPILATDGRPLALSWIEGVSDR